MNSLGYFSLFLAWLVAFSGCFTGLFAGLKSSSRWLSVTANSAIIHLICTVISYASLSILFLNDSYENEYVWQHSSKDMYWVYKLTAVWGGMDGSLLLWSLFLSISTGIVALKFKQYSGQAMPWVLSILSLSNLFFTTLLLFFTNPFDYLNNDFIPAQGNGLNPLLQNPYMAIHPPMLYLGFVNFSIPFAFCLGYLISKNFSDEWIRTTRTWTLIAWCFLTIGIFLGGHWAYLELGWGGFWAWDPVENSSFLPWLTGTAFLHSVMVQQRKDLLKTWNVGLIALTYGLTIFGTSLTRSGIVQSVHAFASTDVGWVFLVYLGIIFALTVSVILLRRKELRSTQAIESLFSRETVFLLNNLLLLSICFSTLWGVMFPVFSETITGKRQTVGAPFFNAINTPLFLALIFMMAIGPVLAWRKSNLKQVAKNICLPIITAGIVGVTLVIVGVGSFYTTLSYSLSWLVLACIMQELHRGAKNQKGDNLVLNAGTVLKKNRIRYGGYLVHIGVAVVCLAATASMAHKQEEEFALKVGETKQFNQFSFKLLGIEETSGKGYVGIKATTNAKRSESAKPELLEPEMRRYFPSGETTSEVALHMGALEDIYLVLSGTEDNKAIFKVFINPLQVWLWIGACVMVLGTLIVLVPRRISL